MAYLINATVVINGRVIDGTYQTGTMVDTGIRAMAIGMVVLRSIDEARKQGYHMADPNAFVRVEFKHVQ